MHSMHHSIQAQQLQQFQEQRSQQQTQQATNNNQQEAHGQQQQQDQPTTMTVLETLEPVRAPQQQPQQQQQPPPILSNLDQTQPASSTTNTSSSSPPPPGTGSSATTTSTVIHQQLVQTQPPLLHQLQAPSNRCGNLLEINEQHLHQQQDSHQLHQQQQQFRPTNNDKLARQRPQIEGIVADGGGPIVQWLLDNYEIADGESLPRSTVYNHYLAHCRQLQMSPVNAASFGKLIRSVFVGLKTRRLGTRGHSKYHYFGVRAKQHVRLDWIQQEQEMDLVAGGPAGSSRDANENSNQNTDNGSESDSTGGRLSSSGVGSGSPSKRAKRSNQSSYQSPAHGHFVEHSMEHPTDAALNQANGFYYSNGPLNGYEMNNNNNDHHHHLEHHSNHHHSHQHQHLHPQAGHKHNGNSTSADCFVWPLDHCDMSLLRSHLAPNWASLVDDNWPLRQPQQAAKEGGQTGDEHLLDNNLLELFEANYRHFYRRMVELLSELKFAHVEQLCFDFWHPAPANNRQATESTVHWTTTTTNNSAGSAESQSTAPPTNTDAMGQEHLHNQQHNGHHMDHHNYQQQPQLLSLSENTLTFNQLYQLTSQPKVIERVNQIDYCLYAAIESFLLPDIISQVPHALNQNIRLFAELIGNWIELAIKDYAAQFVAEKSRSARAFGHALRRYASINHLSGVSRAIWDKRPILDQMSMDLSRIDLRDIEQQVLLMNQAENEALKSPLGEANNELATTTTTTTASGHHQHQKRDSVQQQENNENNDNGADQQAALSAIQPAQIVANFFHLFKDPYPANSWPDWCRNLVESSCVFGNGREGSTILVSLRQDARNFILKWNFYNNLIMKELTLKSAPSLASFQLIRLLFDEYMYYLVVSKLARCENKTLAQLLTPTTGVL